MRNQNCDGCYTQNSHKNCEYKESKTICPCGNCLIKCICVDACASFREFLYGIKNG